MRERWPLPQYPHFAPEPLPFAPRRYANDTATALARKLCEIGPIEGAKVLFTTGGSDAIEVAIKIARAHTGRRSGTNPVTSTPGSSARNRSSTGAGE